MTSGGKDTPSQTCKEVREQKTKNEEASRWEIEPTGNSGFSHDLHLFGFVLFSFLNEIPIPAG